MHFSFKNWAHSVIYLCVCKVWRIINCSWTSEALQNLITKTRSGFWMHTFWVFFFSFFLLPPRGPMEGRWLCRWSGRILQPVPSRAYCAAQSSFPDPGKGGSGQWGPMVLPGWVQADTRSHASCACQALKHPPLCLPSPVTVLWESCVVWWPCSELKVARYLPIPGFFIVGLSPPDLRSLGILYSAYPVFHEVSLLLTLLLLFAFAQPFLQPWLLLGLLLHSCFVPTGESHFPQAAASS